MMKKSLSKDYFVEAEVLRKKKIYEWISNFCHNKSLLELHCGDGYGTGILADRASHIDSVDCNSEKIRFALRNFFVLNKTRFFISDPFDYLKSCRSYEITLVFGTEDIINKNSDFCKLLSMISSPMTVMVFTNQMESIGQYEQMIKQSGIAYKIYYEHEDEINKIKENCKNFIIVLENITNKKIQDASKQKVSIVIPAYNSETTLEETISSALNQSYPNVEIIVVDDGSTDKTKEICEKFNDKIKYYYKQNGGISSALNVGIKKMSGEWFKWLSSDDLLTSDAIEKLMEVHNITGGQIIYSNYDKIDESGNFVGTVKEPVFHDYYEFASKIWIQYIGNASSVLIHKSCFDTIGLFDETLRFGEDYEWWQRASLVYGYRFFYLEKSIVKYRIHSKQLTSKIKDKTFENDQKIRKGIMNYILKTDPEWWDTLIRYRRKHNKLDSKTKMKRAVRGMLHHLSPDMENSVVNLAHKISSRGI